MSISRLAVAFGLGILSAAASPDGSAPDDPYGILSKPIPEKTVVLTFDDACRSHATFVGPLLEKHGLGGTFYICEFGKTFADKTMYMTWEQIKALDEMGFEIGNHTVGHGWLGATSVEGCTLSLMGIEDHCRANKVTKPETWGRFASPAFKVTAGSHTLALILGEGGMVLIDEVALRRSK